jgi:hypothetical protein
MVDLRSLPRHFNQLRRGLRQQPGQCALGYFADSPLITAWNPYS